MSDAVDSEPEISRDASVETSDERTPLPPRAKICLSVGGLVLLAGVLVGFGIEDWYFSLWTSHPGWSTLLTVAVILIGGLFFDRTRLLAVKALLIGLLLFILFWMAVFSGRGWYVFFTTGMNIDQTALLPLSKSGAALILAGIVMLVTCGCIHFGEEDAPIHWRIAGGAAYIILITALTLLIFSISTIPSGSARRNLTADEVSTLRDCAVTEGLTKVRCYLPEAPKEGSAR